jgi:hypothetical protein
VFDGIGIDVDQRETGNVACAFRDCHFAGPWARNFGAS